MVSVRIATCLAAFAAAVSAAPVLPAENALTYETLNVTDTADRTLRNGERVVFGNGRSNYSSPPPYWSFSQRVPFPTNSSTLVV